MKRYNSYKDSGVEWIGEIPTQWKKTKHKFQIDVLSGYPFKSELFDPNEGFPIIRIRDITSGKIETYYTGEIIDDFIIRKGDLLVGMDGDFNIRWWDNDEGLLNQRCCSIKEGEEVLRRYLFYILPSQLKIINDLTYFTTVKHLSVSDINNTSTILPTLNEQHQIVSFLDEKTSLIDSLIEKTQRKIELLKEERISLINHTVTKGLNPNVEMKDSGVEWIGEIPSHWEITKLKYEFNISGGGTPSKEKPEYWDGDIPWVSPKDMKSKLISKTEDYVTLEGVNNSSTKLIRDKSLLMVVRSGILQHTIPICFNSVPVTINQDLKSFEEKKDLIINYLYYYIKGHEKNLLLEWSKDGTTVESIEMDFMMNSELPNPPLSEQEEIVRFLDEKTTTIDKTIELEGKRIELLKEYRQSLISEVVTGKIKVITDE